MWLIGVYHQVSLFSLKPSDVSSTGGRSLLVPTPFSIKMALLDCGLRLYGKESGEDLFNMLRGLAIAVNPPIRIVVNNCFVRIQKPYEPKQSKEQRDLLAEEEGFLDNKKKGQLIPSIGFREYVAYNGPLGIALNTENTLVRDRLALLLPQITSFGKRGSFFQIDSAPFTSETLPVRPRYIPLTTPPLAEEAVGHTLQLMDDCAEEMTFAHADIYSDKAIRVGKERIIRPVALPYKMAHASKGFTVYERLP